MPRLVIATFLRMPGRAMESFENPTLPDLLYVFLTRQRILKKSLAIISRKCFLIGQEPRLHHLNHQMSLVISDTRGALPLVALACAEMMPRRRSDGSLGIYQQNHIVSGVLSNGRTKVLVGLLTTPRCYDLKRPWPNNLLQKCCKGLATVAFCTSLEATLNINTNPHQRFPPISPVRQSWPNRYRSSHSDS